MTVPPPADQFTSRGTCHWCGARRKKTATVRNSAIEGKTRVCLDCAGYGPETAPGQSHEFMAQVIIEVPITAKSREKAQQRAGLLAEAIQISWPKRKWTGSEYEITARAEPPDAITWLK